MNAKYRNTLASSMSLVAAASCGICRYDILVDASRMDRPETPEQTSHARSGVAASLQGLREALPRVYARPFPALFRYSQRSDPQSTRKEVVETRIDNDDVV